MTTIDDIKKELRSKRKEAHQNMDHKAEKEDTREAGKFSAYTDAVNLINKIDEVRVDIE